MHGVISCILFVCFRNLNFLFKIKVVTGITSFPFTQIAFSKNKSFFVNFIKTNERKKKTFPWVGKFSTYSWTQDTKRGFHVQDICVTSLNIAVNKITLQAGKHILRVSEWLPSAQLLHSDYIIRGLSVDMTDISCTISFYYATMLRVCLCAWWRREHRIKQVCDCRSELLGEAGRFAKTLKKI